MSKEHGVYLGGNRWGGKEGSHKDVKNVPVFAEEDAGVIETLAKVDGKKVDDAVFQAVESGKNDKEGFVSRKSVEGHEQVAGEMGEGAGEESPHGKGRHRRKKVEDEPQTEPGGEG